MELNALSLQRASKYPLMACLRAEADEAREEYNAATRLFNCNAVGITC